MLTLISRQKAKIIIKKKEIQIRTLYVCLDTMQFFFQARFHTTNNTAV